MNIAEPLRIHVESDINKKKKFIDKMNITMSPLESLN